MKTKTATRCLIAAFLLIPFLLFMSAVWRAHHSTPEFKLTQGSVLPTPKTLPDFQLQDMNGNSFSNQNVQGHWSLFFFGFTRCPDICPTTLSLLAQAEKIAHKTTGSFPQVVFISVDPNYDTPTSLKHYLMPFSPNFIGATGSTAQINALTHALGVSYATLFQDNKSSLVHSNFILLINPEGQWAGLLTPPYQVSTIVNDANRLPRIST